MFNKNLKYYRLQKNMSKKELADKCGVSAMAITHYENGDRKPDIDMIKKLAEALGVFVADFLTERNTSLSFVHGEFRKQASLPESKQEYIRESVEEYFSRFFDAVECLGGNPLPEPPKTESIKWDADVERCAERIKQALGLSRSGPVKELYAVLENKGFLIMELDVDSRKFSGMNGKVNQYPYIVVNENMSPERKRSTIAHELVHIMSSDMKCSEEVEEEKRATAVAGAFLISLDDVHRELGAHRTRVTKDYILTCEEYGISMYLLVKRAALAGIISSSLEKNFYIRANKAGYQTNEPVHIKDPESPTLLRQLVYRAVNEEGLSMARGAELLGTSIAEMEQFCGLAVT